MEEAIYTRSEMQAKEAEIYRLSRRLEQCEAALPKVQAAINAVRKHVVTEDILWLLEAARAFLEG